MVWRENFGIFSLSILKTKIILKRCVYQDFQSYFWNYMNLIDNWQTNFHSRSDVSKICQRFYFITCKKRSHLQLLNSCNHNHLLKYSNEEGVYNISYKKKKKWKQFLRNIIKYWNSGFLRWVRKKLAQLPRFWCYYQENVSHTHTFVILQSTCKRIPNTKKS